MTRYSPCSCQGKELEIRQVTQLLQEFEPVRLDDVVRYYCTGHMCKLCAQGRLSFVIFMLIGARDVLRAAEDLVRGDTMGFRRSFHAVTLSLPS
jgi:hypothetical protein